MNTQTAAGFAALVLVCAGVAGCEGTSKGNAEGGNGGTSGPSASGGRSGSGGSVATGSGGATTAPGTGGISPPSGNGGSSGGTPDAALPADGPFGAPEPDPTATVVEAFKGTHVFFAGTEMNQRKVDVEVDFPTGGPWKQVILKLALRCPEPGKCDFWDRWAYLGVVNGVDRDSPVTEIMRFATPYRVEASFSADVTALQPLLKGKKRLRVFIDTWVGPGHAQGFGWKVDASFAFAPGKPDRLPIAVLPLWDVAMFETGNPAKPIDGQVMGRMAAIPAEAGSVELRSFITGHGQGNAGNCAEFCPKTHSFTVGGKSFDKRIWRDDCAMNPVRPQAGTWQYPRAGWCPGALAEPWVVDVSAGAAAGTTVPVGYGHEPYVNSCRPDSPTCTGCAQQAGCMYNDSSHTTPQYVHSALLVVYGK